MPNEIGIVSKVKPRDKTYSVAVNKQWFGGFGKCPVLEGETVKIEWKQKGDFKNILKIEKVEPVFQDELQQAPEIDSRINDIRLQVCVKAAAGVFAGTKINPSEIAEYSRNLFKELWGK